MLNITIYFAPHRLEALGFYKQAFLKSDIIILEDAPHPLFPSFLLGQISLEGFMQTLDTEFPLFLTNQYQLIKEAYLQGKVIAQIDPYMERLLNMYQLIEEGKSAQEISELPHFKAVYDVEHKASGALINFYQASLDNFQAAVRAVCQFAQADAQRIALRDKMRAEAIADYLKNKQGQVFIEAGYIHLFLAAFLKQTLGQSVSTKFLMGQVAKKISQQILGRPLLHPFVPGDLLTFWYLAGRCPPEPKEKLWAARTLIYNKLTITEELSPTPQEPYPHLKEEFKIKATLSQLTYDHCERLYPLIKLLPRHQAWSLVNKAIK